MKQLSKNYSSLLFTILTALMIVVSFISYQKFIQFNKSVDAVMHTNLVKSKMINLYTNLKDANSSQRDYLLTNDKAFLKSFKSAENYKYLLNSSLKALLADNPLQLKNLKNIEKLVDEIYFHLNNTLIKNENNRVKFLTKSSITSLEKRINEVDKKISLMVKIEDNILLQRSNIKDRSASITPIFLLVLSLISIIFITIFFYRLQKETNERILISKNNLLLKKANEQIEISEKHFRNFANNIQNLAWIADPEGWIYWYNKRWLDYTGLKLEDLEGWGWEKAHHPDYVEEIKEKTKKLWLKEEEFELTFPLRRHDGKYRWFLTRVYPIKDIDGNIERWIGTNTDISEQKSFTEQLEISVNERTKQLNLQNQTYELAEKIAKFGSYTWRLDENNLKYSDNLFLLLDCEPNEFVPTFEKFLSFVHPDDKLQFIKNGEETKINGVLIESPYRIITKKGIIKYFRSSGKFIGDDKNRMLVGTVQDISKDVLASQDLKNKNIELENANSELESFSFVASHDLQEPLRKIQGFSKRIIDEEGDRLSETTKDYFNRIRAASQRMQNLIESVLNFSQNSYGEFVFEKTNLNTTLKEVEATLQVPINLKKAKIESQILPTLNAVNFQMHQLFLNLISNSLKYSKQNFDCHIKITAKKVTFVELIENVKQNVNFWEIKISDNGIGLEQQYENKIFEPFQRLHSKTEYEGTGIGLAICKKIVQTHKGRISAKGEIGVGTTFTFLLSDNINS